MQLCENRFLSTQISENCMLKMYINPFDRSRISFGLCLYVCRECRFHSIAQRWFSRHRNQMGNTPILQKPQHNIIWLWICFVFFCCEVKNKIMMEVIFPFVYFVFESVSMSTTIVMHSLCILFVCHWFFAIATITQCGHFNFIWSTITFLRWPHNIIKRFWLSDLKMNKFVD